MSGGFGLFPLNRRGDDIVLFADDDSEEVSATFYTLRQQTRKAKNRSNRALADFIAPDGYSDYLGMFAVSAGNGVAAMVDEFERDQDDYSAILVKSLADRIVAAFTEWRHARVMT